MDISVVLGTYNRSASLELALQSFAELEVPADITWELLIVDNNSNDKTRAVVEKFSRQSRFLVRYAFEARQGRSAALNTGIRESNGEIIVFTDDDVLLHRDWLSNLKATFDRFHCEAVAGRVMPLWNHPKPDWLEMEGQFAVVNYDLGDELKEIKIPPLGANSAFRREVFARHGLFRLDLGVTGSRHTITCDDTEFGERLIRAGDKIVYCPSAIVYHPVEPGRTTKAYFLSWYYYNGVSLTRTIGLSQECVFLWGVPRWLYREFATNLAKWLVTLDGRRRFHRKLRTYRSMGKIVESYRLSRSSCPLRPELERPLGTGRRAA